MPGRRYSLPHLAFLQGFEAAARTLSFTKAAEELFITQSAVSRQIKALEDNLGLRLFERRSRSLTLTDNGHALSDRHRRLRSAAGRDRPAARGSSPLPPRRASLRSGSSRGCGALRRFIRISTCGCRRPPTR
jgi:DNA-binding transcriptional LysR family regulator